MLAPWVATTILPMKKSVLGARIAATILVRSLVAGLVWLAFSYVISPHDTMAARLRGSFAMAAVFAVALILFVEVRRRRP